MSDDQSPSRWYRHPNQILEVGLAAGEALKAQGYTWSRRARRWRFSEDGRSGNFTVFNQWQMKRVLAVWLDERAQEETDPALAAIWKANQRGRRWEMIAREMRHTAAVD